MEVGITREEALGLVKGHLQSESLLKHCLATEAIMRALAKRLGADAEAWGIAGLLHDLDYNETKECMEEHGRGTERILRQKGVGTEVIGAILAHNAENLGIERSSAFDFALTCAETITGLVIATALVYPDKKLASVKPSSIIKRMKQKEFARAVNREHIRLCEKIGIPLEEFCGLSLSALQEIHEELGL
jgi:putative nucleotidyltransferase with HDIG domain